ncbi:ead/Ea22-like family protein [Klebsiella pneumoniae]|nr:ead/Ea22-like family protein [Klebsiella pneumoniae]HBX2708958.1 ead/Ea22-like family protein [Klebsiella pneumoniae]
MTDITELAQSLKNAASKALIEEGLTWFSEEQLSHEDGIALHKADAEFIALANPANVLALVDALEKAQSKIIELQQGYEIDPRTHEIIDLQERIAELEYRTVTAAAADVLAERQRQVTTEGWSPKHDDQYKNTELAFAASCYAFHAAAASWDLEDNGIPYDSHPVPKQWPWEPSWWRPTDARRDLVKAGALILAEIERIDRAAGIKVEAE